MSGANLVNARAWLLSSVAAATLGANSSLAATLTVVPDSTNVNVSDLIEVQLIAGELGDGLQPNLAGFDLTLAFDASGLLPLGAEFAGFLGDVLLGEVQVESTVGVADVSLFSLSFLEDSEDGCLICFPPYLDDLQPSSFLIATIFFDAIASGQSELDFVSVVLSDGAGVELGVTTVGATVTIVPEPTRFWFVALALGFTLARTRRHESR